VASASPFAILAFHHLAFEDRVEAGRRWARRERVRQSPVSTLAADHPRVRDARAKARGMTQKEIASEFEISINTVGNLAANAYTRLGVLAAAAVVHAHRDRHFYCGTRVDFGRFSSASKASRPPREWTLPWLRLVLPARCESSPDHRGATINNTYLWERPLCDAPPDDPPGDEQCAEGDADLDPALDRLEAPEPLWRLIFGVGA
jgi:hypothetical protein